MISTKWHAESQAVRDYWHDVAHEAKEKHKLMYPDYVFKPRKSSEKKRRMTKKKAAAFTAQAESSVDSGEGAVDTSPQYLFKVASCTMSTLHELTALMGVNPMAPIRRSKIVLTFPFEMGRPMVTSGQIQAIADGLRYVLLFCNLVYCLLC